MKRRVSTVLVGFVLGVVSVQAGTACAHANLTGRQLSRLAAVAPEVTWRPVVIQQDLDGDRIADKAVLGWTKHEAVLGVFLGNSDEPVLLRFSDDRTRSDGICTDPQLVQLGIEPPVSKEDPDAPNEAKQATRPGLRLDVGDCDSVHIYWYSGQVLWWRR